MEMSIVRAHGDLRKGQRQVPRQVSVEVPPSASSSRWDKEVGRVEGGWVRRVTCYVD
jgi:hypothetical protein